MKNPQTHQKKAPKIKTQKGQKNPRKTTKKKSQKNQIPKSQSKKSPPKGKNQEFNSYLTPNLIE